RRPLRIAVMVSGEGTTLDALATALAEHPHRARIDLVVSDREGARALAVAARHRIPTAVVQFGASDGVGTAGRLSTAVHRDRIDLVVLAGLRSILPASWLSGWRGRVVNVHPSLLPRYGGPGLYGRRVYESVLAGGDRESGATVHLVTAEVDAGPRLLQERFPVNDGETPETLQIRTQALERRLLLDAIERFADGRWRLPYEPSELDAGLRA
ncbi:MAG: phosphoribosylglycinamide formyltransferase, partial [Thermoplasmata archaeon]|nr:phosphoribosylglycinamide formyltransferase [Thermoplasmata archaeon]